MDYSQKYKKIFATRPRDEPPRGTPGSHHGRVPGVASEPYILQATIDFSPMPDSENLNNNCTVINGVQNAVIPYSCPVPFFALQPLERNLHKNYPRS